MRNGTSRLSLLSGMVLINLLTPPHPNSKVYWKMKKIRKRQLENWGKG
jgi:hypothetical protein